MPGLPRNPHPSPLPMGEGARRARASIPSPWWRERGSASLLPWGEGQDEGRFAVEDEALQEGAMPGLRNNVMAVLEAAIQGYGSRLAGWPGRDRP